jgi:hypothetical protein
MCGEYARGVDGTHDKGVVFLGPHAAWQDFYEWIEAV